MLDKGPYRFGFPPQWSLSKFGLPAVRTGIVIASKELIRILSGVNAVVNLAPGSFGTMLTPEIKGSGEIIRLSREVIKPFYQEKMEKALACIKQYFTGFLYKVHVPEGAMFLWLWFPGLASGWRHADECLRVTCSQKDEDVRQGIGIIADEIHKFFVEFQH